MVTARPLIRVLLRVAHGLFGWTEGIVTMSISVSIDYFSQFYFILDIKFLIYVGYMF